MNEVKTATHRFDFQKNARFMMAPLASELQTPCNFGIDSALPLESGIP
jgi:hypothetical protein